MLAFVAVRWLRLGGVGAFPLAGGAAVHPGTPRELALYPTGYDGEFVYRLALDPFTQSAAGHGITLDLPAYRQQRIMTALVAHLVAGLPGVGVAAALIIVNVAAVCVAIWYGTAFAVLVRRPPAVGLLLAVPACMPISLGRDLTEPVAWAGALAGIYLVRRGRWLGAAVALTVGVLARETTVVIIVGLIAGEAWKLARPALVSTWRASWLLAPLAAATGWQLWMLHVWGTLPIRTGQSANAGSLPVVGVLESLLWGVVGQHSSGVAIGVAELLERLVLLILIAAAAWAVLRRDTAASPGETSGWFLAVVLALSVRRWGTDVAFLRATYESWAMSILVLIQARRVPRYALTAAGLATLAVAGMYGYLT